MKKILNFVLDFLFPPSCPICKEAVGRHGQICAACWTGFNWISDPKCDCCGYPFPSNIDRDKKLLCPECAAGRGKLDWMRSACVYDDFSKKVILPFKHAGAIKYKNVMARAMITALKGIPRACEPRAAICQGLHAISTKDGVGPETGDWRWNAFDLVIPVPLASRRLWKRGYNQAALLAQPIARHFDVPVVYDSIVRRHRPDMGRKSARARAENIRGAFVVQDQAAIRGKRVLLVDDVITTGATFAELRRVLKRAGAAAVYGITFCRAVRDI